MRAPADSDNQVASPWQAFARVSPHAALPTLCLIAVIPLLAVGFPPLVDLFGHLGRYVIQTDLANRPELQPYFSYQWKLIGNLGADLLVQGLHSWLGLEQAVRVIVIIAQLLAAAGVLLMSLAVHRRITPFAIAALPLLYGFPFTYGFINFVLAMALAMITFAVWINLRRAGRVIGALVWLCAAGPLCWISHTYGWAFLGLLCGAASLAEALEARLRPVALAKRVLGACWPLLLPLAAMLAWRSGVAESATSEWYATFKLLWLVSALRVHWMLVDVLSLVGLLCFGYWAVRGAGGRIDRRMGLATVLCLAAFLILPARVFSSFFADMRLMPYVLICALLAISAEPMRPKLLRLAMLVAIGFFLARTGITTAAYIEKDRVITRQLATLDAIPRGARVAFFSLEPCEFSWAPSVSSHLGSVAMVRRNAFANDQWEDTGVNPLLIHYPAAGAFASDPSQLVLRDDCPSAHYPHLAARLAKLPMAAFTHVWIVGEVPPDLPVPAGLSPLAHAGSGKLFAVEPSR